MKRSNKEILSDLFLSALKSVNGCTVVEQQLQTSAIKGKVAVLAVGKAAAAMMLGAQNQLNNQIQSALVITKLGHNDKSLTCDTIESGHPVPNKESLAAGEKLVEFITNIPKGTRFLALISGGASALVEVLAESNDLEMLQKLNHSLLASGLEITEMNRVRQSISLIKAGKALNYLPVNEMTQLLISDVKGDDISIIGSGLFVVADNFHMPTALPNWIKKQTLTSAPIKKVSVESHVVASNEIACQAIIKQAEENNYDVTYYGQTLYGDVYSLADILVKHLLEAKSGIHIWGGEPTLILPEITGRGGRNQSLALALACRLENVKGVTVLVGATDGNDGSTDDAGAIVDGFTLQRGKQIGLAQDFLTSADAGTFLDEAGDLFSTGPTGTNVMDIVIALKEGV